MRKSQSYVFMQHVGQPFAYYKNLTRDIPMKRLQLRSGFLAGLVLLAASLSAQAAPTTWTLDNVTFTDSGRAIGSFTIDAAAQTWSAFDIVTAAPALSDTTTSRPTAACISTALARIASRLCREKGIAISRFPSWTP